MLEHSWDMSNLEDAPYCDPCTLTEPFTKKEVKTLGFRTQLDSGESYSLGHFTALRMRYNAAQATHDLSLYTSPFEQPVQLRYIDYLYEMEQFFPICGEGWAPQPGICVEGQRRTSCAVGRSETSLLGLAAVLGMVWKRRRR